MELIRINLKNPVGLKDDVVATIGQFDGLHLAHLKLIQKTKEIANEKGLKTAIFSFNPHPDFVLKKDLSNTYVTPLHQKISLLEEMGFDYFVLIEFNEDVAKMSPVDFVNKILIENKVKYAIVGFDFRFGNRGVGKAENITELSNNKIKTIIIDEIKYNNEKIGTSLIKKLLKNGFVSDVKTIMGRYYKIVGQVVYGNQIGQTIGFPTANLYIGPEFAEILPGVYIVRVKVRGKFYLGIANLGVNPSFNKVNQMVFETHIFDFDENIYGELIEIELIRFIRKEVTFATVEDFKIQIRKDVEFAKEYTKNMNLI